MTMADLAHAAENDTDLHGDTDARHWAQRFVHRALEYPATPMDEDAMLAWFAGAIETGRMAGQREGHDHELRTRSRYRAGRAARG
jgi:hypothetical protein